MQSLLSCRQFPTSPHSIMPVRKRQSASAGRSGDQKKKRKSTAHEKHEATDTDNFFLDDDEGAPQPEQEEPDEANETAEQKRLRLGTLMLNLGRQKALGAAAGCQICNINILLFVS